MKYWAKEFFASVVCVLLILPSTFIGLLLGMGLYYIYNNIMGLNIPYWLNIIAPPLIGGAIAGASSVFISYKIFKPQRFVILLSLPFVLMVISVFGIFAGVVVLGKPWEGAIEPLSNVVGVVVGLVFMSRELLKRAALYSHQL